MSKVQQRGPAISCESLSVRFGKAVVLTNINFSAEAGKVHCIIGPNGGGKSTLIKAILGQIRHEGTISIAWQDAKEHIGYVPQIIEIDKTLPVTVADFLALCTQHRPAFLGTTSEQKTLISTTLERLGLAGKEKFLFSELSGGERQRVLFAQALIPTPNLLILDEPMNSIDRHGAETFAQLINELKADGVTIILIHHDLEQVEKIGDTVTCINQEILFSGLPKEVMDKKHLLRIFSAKPAEIEVN